ncbi:uncharacterized protein KY384_004668 [Bacidia gigantensis]|uniref:uncharacterized protein n=1 Tax=Bacidia gigantensis TaxID=2732470 RepID=UPI001D040D19|nr:uncharacterized protein KY384_004668 [Bacidia gigantensis]KAG8530630.1 hypothetical protein KY384_004668 [Bacidia gigantensis]
MAMELAAEIVVEKAVFDKVMYGLEGALIVNEEDMLVAGKHDVPTMEEKSAVMVDKEAVAMVIGEEATEEKAVGEKERRLERSYIALNVK